MRILGIDYGDRRTGLAVSDEGGLIASGLATFECRKGDDRPLVEHIRALCEEYGVERIVVGLPINMDGRLGPRAQRTIEFANRLRNALGLDVETWDERLTTEQADRLMLAADLSRARRKRKRDAVAAHLILQSYLDAQGQEDR
ncbi:MAG: Holliday junction resolvase RuvX [Planctomycetota bacterium]